ncbi:MAG: hypothetical protein AAF488_14120 [Planctomycetota bacterium]
MSSSRGAHPGDSHAAEETAPEPSPVIQAALDPAVRREAGDEVLQLDIEDLLELLPQRPPQLLIDRVLALVPGMHAVGLKAVTGNEAGLAKRKHGFVFPATFALEFLVQLASVVRHYPTRFAHRPDAGQKDRRPIGDPLPIGALEILRSVESFQVEREMVIAGRLYGSVSIVGESVDDDGGFVTACRGQVHLGGEPYIEAAFSIAPLEETLDYDWPRGSSDSVEG